MSIQPLPGPSGKNTRRATLADVARHAGVSLSTVSQVVNKRSTCWVSEATRARVLQAVQALGYRTNLAARSLRSGSTRTLGMITTGLGLGNTHNRFMGLDEAASADGYTVMLSFHPNTPETENHLIRCHLDRGVDGLLIYPSEPGPHAELQILASRAFPLVAFDGAIHLNFPCDDVSPDYCALGRLQAAHLLDIGRRHICIANALPAARVHTLREAGACEAIAAAGAPVPLFMNIHRPGDRELAPLETVDRPVREFLKATRGQFDAVIAKDSVAALVVRDLIEMGMRVPGDVAVIGAGDSLIAEYNTLPLTTVSTQEDLIGREAFRLIRERLAGAVPAGAIRRVQPPLRLLVRASTVRA